MQEICYIFFMEIVAKFEKVSFEQFRRDVEANFPSLSLSEIERAYTLITLPKRSTKASAGYDFVSPLSFSLEPNKFILLPSGIRANINSAFVLTIVPRSSLGLKYQLMLANTTGIIDADYYNAKNEGHIMFPLINRGTKTFACMEKERIVQGIFLRYYLAEEEEVISERHGGFGSSGR